MTDKPTDERIDALIDEFQAFRMQYEEDMRGDKRINGGSLGLVNTIRKMKESQDKYPSLTWLLSHKPLPTVAAGIGAFILLSALYTVGLLRLVGAIFGVDIP